MLDEIVASVKVRIEERSRRLPLGRLKENLAGLPRPRDFAAALSSPKRPRIIAEIKRSSPSAGALRPDLRPAETALSYQEAGAAAISILTEEDHFHGSLDDLRAVSGSVGIPVLQKDFILTPYQIYEARTAGADVVLLIAALLDRKILQDLFSLASSLGLSCLVEAHNQAEARTAAALGAPIIGINNRNLSTLKTDLAVGRRLLALVPSDRIRVVESGIRTRSEIEEFQRLGAAAFLIGESLLRGPDPAAALAALLK